MNILQALAGLVPSIGRTIEKFVTDKDLARQLQCQIEAQLIDVQSQVVNAKADIIVAEAAGESWMQRNWRPLTMLTFVMIIANNYIIVPYCVGFGLTMIPLLDIPPGMWSLLTVGIGGYVAGRSWEKIESIKTDRANNT